MPDSYGSVREARTTAARRSQSTGRAWHVVTNDNTTYYAIRNGDAIGRYGDERPYRTVATYRDGQKVETQL